MKPCRFIRRPVVSEITTFGETQVYDQVKRGLLPAPIKLTARSSVWIEAEIYAINAARAAGKTEDEIRTLVRQLVAQRAAASGSAAA